MHNKNVSSSNLTYSGFTETPVKMIFLLSRKLNFDYFLLPTCKFTQNQLCLQDKVIVSPENVHQLPCMEISTVLNFMISHCTDSDGLVFTFALTCYQKAYFFIPGEHFHWKKNNNFWVVGNYSNVVCKVLCWHKKITIRVFGHLCLNSQ